MTGSLAALPAMLPLTRWPMRVRTPVGAIATRAMCPPWADLTRCRPVALQLVRHDHTRHIQQPLEQLPQELLRGFLVPPTLHQEIEEVVVLIHGAPQVMARAGDGQKHRVEMPVVAGPRPSTPQRVGVILTALETPVPDGLVGPVAAAFEPQCLPIAVAQVNAIVEPHPVADDVAGTTVVFIALGVGERGHVQMPIAVLPRSRREHHRGEYVMGWEGGSTT